MSFLDSLSPSQREAASNFEGASLIIAGAGSGKTRTLTYRIAHMIQSGVSPINILALTFTNKAAREMRERMATILSPDALRGLWMGTFHGVFRRILNAEAAVIGYPQNFTLYDTSDSTSLVKTIIKELSLNEDKYKPRDVFSRISFAKNSLVTPGSYEANVDIRAEDSSMRRPELYRIYKEYSYRCKANGAMDFDDLLLNMNYLLRDHPEVAAKYCELFRYIMVDEYQDTNFSQYLIVKKLAALHSNICVVGDDSQSIYSFRGAKIENILRFEKDFPEAQVFRLEENYRSTKTIVEASNSLIEHNKGKLKKHLFSSGVQGDKIRVFEAFTDKDEAARIVNDIASTIYSLGASPSDFAILYRTHFQSRVLEEQLRSKGISYQIFGGNSFYSRIEIKAMLCYLRLAVNPADDEAFKRIINFPARGIGGTSLQKIESVAAEKETSMFEILRTTSPSEIGIRGVASKGIASFLEAFTELSSKVDTLDAYEFASEVAVRSGMLSFFKASGSVEDKSRVENIEELLNAIKSFAVPEEMGQSAIITEEAALEETDEKTFGISEWLAEASLLSDLDTEKDDGIPKVGLMTVHASKGLEFKYVYIVGLEDKLFPSLRQEFSDGEIEEERRLFYVAITRAKTRVTLSYALSRFQWGEVKDCLPSRFLKEIDEQYLDNSACNGAAVRDRGFSSGRFGGGTRTFPSKGETAKRTTTGGSQGGYGSQRKFGDTSQRSGTSQHSSTSQRTTSPSPQNSNSDWLKLPTTRGSMTRVARSEGVAIAEAEGLAVGTRVSHERFGRGEIISMEKTPTDVKLTVEFEGIGTKTLLQKFAKLIKL
ncbi:MAG: UvrD-helicase domain-containing protein [Rikenellaceae bacterium]